MWSSGMEHAAPRQVVSALSVSELGPQVTRCRIAYVVNNGAYVCGLRAVAAVCVSGRHMAFTGCARATPSNDMHRTIAMGEKTSNLFIFVYSMRKRVLDLSVHNLLELLILWMCLLGTYLVCYQSSLKLSRYLMSLLFRFLWHTYLTFVNNRKNVKYSCRVTLQNKRP